LSLLGGEGHEYYCTIETQALTIVLETWLVEKGITKVVGADVGTSVYGIT